MTNPKTPPNPSQFIHTHTLTKISISQILYSTGFKSAKSSALDSLTRITGLFLHHLSSSAASRTDENPSLTNIVSAVEELNFPLDFSIPQLTGFITCPDHQPFSHRVPKPELPIPLPEHGDSTTSRGPEVPSWLPAFPRVNNSDDDLIGNNNVEGKELYWEKNSVLPTVVTKEVAKEKAVRKRKRGVGEIMVYGRRKRMKFKLEGRKKAKAGNVDDLELRNGVCRGGKRVGLVRQVGCSRFFEDGDDDDGV